MDKTKNITIQFIPTGNKFELPQAEVERILKNDRGNYKVLKGAINLDKTNNEKTKTVMERVIE